MESNDSGELESIIDGALSTYSSAEPLAGLEERVLNRIHGAEAGRRRFGPWRWTAAVSALAAMVVAAIALRPRHTPDVRQTSFVAATPPPSRPERRVGPKRSARTATRRALSPKSYPKQAQFPAPAPLTVEERALLAFVEAPRAFAELQKRNNEPIEIQPIQIAPLQIDGAQ
jgi:hypothetical protein